MRNPLRKSRDGWESTDLCLHGPQGLSPITYFEEEELLLKAAPEAQLGTLPVESAQDQSPETEGRVPSDQRTEPPGSAGLGAPPFPPPEV